MVVMPRNRWNDAETTPKRRLRKWSRACGEPPTAHGCHPPTRGVARPLTGGVAHWPSMRGVTHVPSIGAWEAAPPPMAETCRRRGFRQNLIKASLSVFQRREVKVLGFDVKARPRPQRMALRWVYDPFALVGANGKACGEAPGVLFPGTPPGYGWRAPPAAVVC